MGDWVRYDRFALNIITCPTAAADGREYELCAQHLLNLEININQPLHSSILLPFKLHLLHPTCNIHASVRTLRNRFQRACCEALPATALSPSPLKTFGDLGNTWLRGSISFPPVEYTLHRVTLQSSELSRVHLVSTAF